MAALLNTFEPVDQVVRVLSYANDDRRALTIVASICVRISASDRRLHNAFLLRVPKKFLPRHRTAGKTCLTREI